MRYLFSYTRYELGSFEMSFVLRGLHPTLLMGMVMSGRIARRSVVPGEGDLPAATIRLQRWEVMVWVPS